jgi:uncharacterized protein (TIGR03435 family)
MPVFALVIGKGGPKLAPDTSDPNGLLKQQNWTGNGQHVEQLKNVSIAELTQILQFHVDRPVVDQTGLKARYDLDLRWATDDGTASGADAPPGLFTAIQEQIGLKLEPVKAPGGCAGDREAGETGSQLSCQASIPSRDALLPRNRTVTAIRWAQRAPA